MKKGTPIDGAMIGAIGVSGARPAEDEAVAAAGLAALSESNDD